jgi:alkylation response protein AidB-like acyl-CoA dehydrogenase
MSEYSVDRGEPILPPAIPGNPYAARTQERRNVAHPEPALNLEQLLRSTLSLADDIAARPNRGSTTLPREDLHQLAALGLLRAPLPTAHGGLGLGLTPEGHLPLLRLLSIVGGADLVLGRLYEGHVNAVLLVATFGAPSQLARAAQDCRDGRWFGVWNTGRPEVLRLEPGPRNGQLSYVFQGAKTFASGAAFVQRPIVTAQLEGRGWQMTLPRMESAEVAGAIAIDRSFWHPLGMEASESFGVDFSGAAIHLDDLIGAPGDFYRDPLFYGGAIRFSAVQAGAILRLHRLFAERLETSGSKDPYQVARLGEIAIGAQEAVLWIERAAAVAAECFSIHASKLQIERMHETADMTRLSIERIATALLARVVAGVGAHGLLQPSPFERIVRDLTMYLRQPVADHTLATVGRTSLRKSSLRVQGAGNGFWLESTRDDSLPPAYFERLYQRHADPWAFETSDYEAGKYRQTLAALPRERYETVLEVGCSIGVLTAQLAARTDSLLGVDVSDKALDAARRRCAALPNVRFTRMQIPNEEPSGCFDLIVVSEVAYYWQREDLDRAIDMFAAHMTPGSHLLLVHHTKPVPDYPLTGDQVHEVWLARPEWRLLTQQRHEGYRLDMLERCPWN